MATIIFSRLSKFYAFYNHRKVHFTPTKNMLRFFFQEDFSDCFALQCSTCPAVFCAWCLADCNNMPGLDPHNHVLDCVQSPEPMRGHALFLNDDNGGPHVPPNPYLVFEKHWLFKKEI